MLGRVVIFECLYYYFLLFAVNGKKLIEATANVNIFIYRRLVINTSYVKQTLFMQFIEADLFLDIFLSEKISVQLLSLILPDIEQILSKFKRLLLHFLLLKI